MKLMIRYLKNYKMLILLNVISVFGFALVELGIPTIMAKVIDNGIANNDINYIKRMGLVIVVISIVGVLGSILLGYCSSKISTSVTRDIRNDIFRKAQEFSHSEYDKFGISSMITRTTNDAFQLLQFINTFLRTAILTPVMFLVSVVMILKTNLSLSVVLKESIVLIVAQRISSIMDADKILVLNEGQVVGMGTHRELLKNCHIYHEIALSQLTEEELA